MPAYSFKERFVPFVMNKTKRCTIRGFRKYPVKPGQPAMLYYGMRTKYIRKIWDGEDWPLLIDVKTVVIYPEGMIYVLDTNWIEPHERELILKKEIKLDSEYLLSEVEKEVFAWNDGFRHTDRPYSTDGCFEIMYRYWSMNGGLPFIGFISYW